MKFDAVVFGAHPDDAEMGMGGTVARLTQLGHSVLIVSLTAGECGTFGTPEIRAREASAAAKILGCGYRILDFPDTRVVCDVPSRERVMDLLREVQPRIVFAPWYASTMGHRDGASHLDHLATGELAREAIKLARLRGRKSSLPAHDVRRLYYYMVPRNRLPTLYIDVSTTLDTVMQSISAYESQMKIEKQGTAILDVLRSYRAWYGIGAGCQYAEGFLCEDPLHPDVEALLSL